MPIPIIDLFAGPGGLGEGFSSFPNRQEPAFQIRLSIEKDPIAYQTLMLRSFVRQFPEPPESYYAYLQSCGGDRSREQLFDCHPREAALAASEALNAELGVVSNTTLDERIRAHLRGADPWVLIGGPPCQAYSLVGRSRMRSLDPIAFEQDHRHFLYREYLRIIAEHKPAVFVMENVKGLLSATHGGQPMFRRICDDLQAPGKALRNSRYDKSLGYTLYPLQANRLQKSNSSDPDFVIRAEILGSPQSRHRVIIVGVRSDAGISGPEPLQTFDQIPIEAAISDLPRLRSALSKEVDSPKVWRLALQEMKNASWLQGIPDRLRVKVTSLLSDLDESLPRGAEFLEQSSDPKNWSKEWKDWFIDKNLKGICNHSSRSHIRPDLHRYFFCSAFATIPTKSVPRFKSPVLSEFPKELLPLHANVNEAVEGKKFCDRFRVQVQGRPSTTITSHIAKDGHYFIHYDPLQCRSLTVREAARLQTFPDNYFFEGPRTAQYHQVGNAVPPLVARRIAERVYRMLS
jgi:DNA (cytosine-5)-methyltransferase 1